MLVNHHITIMGHTPSCMHFQTHSNTLERNGLFQVSFIENDYSKLSSCKQFKITSYHPGNGSNQFNKIKYYVQHEQARKICNNLEALHISKIIYAHPKATSNV